MYENTFQVQAQAPLHVPAPENIIYHGSPNNIQRRPFSIYYAESTPAFSASLPVTPMSTPIVQFNTVDNEIAFNNAAIPIMASSSVLNVPMQSPGVVETSRDDKKLMMFAGATAGLFLLSRLHG